MYGDFTDTQLVGRLRHALHTCEGEGVVQALLQELEDRAIQREAAVENRDSHLWPQGIFDVALEVFGRGMYARNGRSYKTLDRRIRHALGVWDSKYGPLNPEQEAYAVDVIVAVIRGAKRASQGDTKHLWASTLDRLSRCVHDDRVHAGFIRRAQSVDVSEAFAELLAS